jgi:hypothetical protein
MIFIDMKAKYYPDDYNPANVNYIFTKKKCDTCRTDKLLENFHLSKSEALGRKSTCKECRHSKKELYAAQRKEKYKNDLIYRENTLRKMAARKKLPKHRAWLKKYYQTKLKYDVAHRIRASLHTRLKQVLKESGERKSMFMKEIVGCTHKELLIYIESTWKIGMNWNNYGWGNGKWVIDHIIPCAAFDLTNKENQKKCFNHKNLRASWWLDNARKNCFLDNGDDARKIYKTAGYKSQAAINSILACPSSQPIP